MNEDVKQIYLRNYGSEKFFKRSYCKNLIYTEGILDLQMSLKAYWVVDEIINSLPNIIREYKDTGDGFYIITIAILRENKAVLEVFREGFEGEYYNEHIEVLKIELFDVELPVYDYKFYLILSNLEPIIFTLMLTSEY